MNGLTITFLLLGAFQVTLCAVVQAPVSSPNIISRTQWGARAPKSSAESLAENPPPFVVIHHSATPTCTTQAICQLRVKSFQNYHMDEKKWNDIGYNFVVGEDGNVYEGRGWGKRGAHSVEFNSKSIGICFIGDYNNREPSKAAVNAAKGLIAYGVSIGQIKDDYTLYGHRQTSQTNCPGNKLYELIKSWPHWAENRN